MSYQDVKDKLYHGQKIANNTYLTLDGSKNIIVDIREPSDIRELSEHIDMRLHSNLVARFYPDYLQLYSAGRYNMTTKNRLNLALELAIDDWRNWFIYQRNRQWYYGNLYQHVDDPKFYDGMKIDYTGKVIS